VRREKENDLLAHATTEIGVLGPGRVAPHTELNSPPSATVGPDQNVTDGPPSATVGPDQNVTDGSPSATVGPDQNVTDVPSAPSDSVTMVGTDTARATAARQTADRAHASTQADPSGLSK